MACHINYGLPRILIVKLNSSRTGEVKSLFIQINKLLLGWRIGKTGMWEFIPQVIYILIYGQHKPNDLRSPLQLEKFAVERRSMGVHVEGRNSEYERRTTLLRILIVKGYAQGRYCLQIFSPVV